MAEVKPTTSRGEDAVHLVGEPSGSGTDGSTSPKSVPFAIAAESPSFLKSTWIQILSVCSGLWGARRGGLSGPRVLGLAPRAQHSPEDSESEILSRIAASKSTWSEVPAHDIDHSVPVPRPNQLSVWEELKASAPLFFLDWGDWLKVGRKIAEGGQAKIFEAKLEGLDKDLVLKVFKLSAGFTLADLKQHWPRSVRKDGEGGSESASGQERSFGFVFEDATANMYGERCLIFNATLLRDGRFAFVMFKYWGDLRTLIDLKVEEKTHPWEFDLLCRNRREQPLFSLEESIWIMLQIAIAMERLHAQGVLHRDLKAANVLIRVPESGRLSFNVADYECAMFVQGTRFWRAPKVLQEFQKKEEDRNGGIWSQKVDVYSFGMTCYEILTGQIPFGEYTKKNWGDVIRGERPFSPDFVHLKLRELVEACWHIQPSQRPPFDRIVHELDSLLQELGFL